MHVHRWSVLITTWCVTLYCEVLVLAHELAAIEEIFPYLSLRLSPMPVVEMVGRSREMDPTCPRDASVYHWWRGRVLFFFSGAEFTISAARELSCLTSAS